MTPEISLTQNAAHVRHGSNIGQPLTRRDGVLKVTGAARYAADNHPPGMLYAVMAVSSIARGRVTFLDVAAAKRHPGVVEVMTPANRPPLAEDPDAKTAPFHVPARGAAERPGALRQPADRGGDRRDAGGGDRRRGAAGADNTKRCRRASVSMPAKVSCPPRSASAIRPRCVAATSRPASPRQRTRIEATYETPAQYHNAMEPHAIVATWDGDRLTIDTPSQGLAMAQGRIAGLFGIPPENIHIRSPFLGGGFGSKGLIDRAADPRHPGGADWSAGRSSWCCAASRCTARSAIARRPARRCASASTARAG